MDLAKLLYISRMSAGLFFFFQYIDINVRIFIKLQCACMHTLSRTLTIRMTQLNYIFCSFESGYVYEASIHFFLYRINFSF